MTSARVRRVINTVLQAIAVVVTAVSWVPQAVRSLHSSDRTGVSVSSWGLGAATGLVFCLYGITSSVWGLAVSEGAFALGAAAIVAPLVGPRRTMIYVGLCAVASVLVVWLSNSTMIGVIGIAGALGMRLLQMVRTLRTRSVAGMSSGSWILLCANVTAWGLYGLRTDHWPLVVTSALALAAALALLIVARHFRRID